MELSLPPRGVFFNSAIKSSDSEVDVVVVVVVVVGKGLRELSWCEVDDGGRDWEEAAAEFGVFCGSGGRGGGIACQDFDCDDGGGGAWRDLAVVVVGGIAVLGDATGVVVVVDVGVGVGVVVGVVVVVIVVVGVAVVGVFVAVEVVFVASSVGVVVVVTVSMSCVSLRGDKTLPGSLSSTPKFN